MPLHCIFASLSLGFMALLILAERAEHKAGRWITKILASLAFVALGFSWGVPTDALAWALVTALILSLFGDIFLLPTSESWFTAGLGSFLLAHLGFAAAFIIRGISPLAVGIALIPLVAIAMVVHVWLRDWTGKLQKPVIAYISVITAMVALSVGTLFYRFDAQGILLAAGAISFFLSDLAVARDRFLAPTWLNRAWGLPLYYGAQVIFAWSIGVGS